MATTKPTDAVLTNIDQGSDDVGLARGDLNTNWGKFNDLLDAIGAAGLLNLQAAGGLETAAQGAGTPDDLKIKLQTVSGLLLAAAGLRVDVNGLTSIAALGNDDELLVWDVGNSVLRKLTVGDLGGGWSPIDEYTEDVNNEIDVSPGITTAHSAYKLEFNGVYPGSAGRGLRLQWDLATSGWTVDDAAGSIAREVYQAVASGFTSEAASAAVAFLNLSVGRSIDNVAASAMHGSLEFYGIGDQANHAASFRGTLAFRDDATGNQAGGQMFGGLRTDLNTENVEGMKLYLTGAGALNGSVQLYGQSFTPAT